MNIITDQTFDEERALYGRCELTVNNCSFDGPCDGESAFKECKNIAAENCFFNLRYPFWHNKGVYIGDSEMTENCRAALWYTENIKINNTKIHGIKALRECRNAVIESCDIISPEFGWSVKNIKMNDCTAQSEYFLMRSEDVLFNNVSFKGKYSFQYIKNGVFENCVFDTKDAFWHTENVTVRNSIVKGEYLGWYSDNLTLENCKITGTQPLCYCKGLKLINCEMTSTDLCFEKSEVYANITSNVESIKNPKCGIVYVPSVDQIIRNDKNSECKIIICSNNNPKVSA